MTELRNLFEIQTDSGIKTVELHEGDITKLSFKIDILVTSAFTGHYLPVKGSLIQAMQQIGVDMEALSRKPLLDLRDKFNVWLSTKIDRQNFKYVACVEIVSLQTRHASLEKPVSGLFSLLAATQFMDIPLASVAMPLIGTGQQRLSPNEMLARLLPLCQKALHAIPGLRKVIFVEIAPERVEKLDEAMNELLGRSSHDTQRLPKTAVAASLIGELIDETAHLKSTFEPHDKTRHVIHDLQVRLKDRNLRFFEQGIFFRRLIEALLADLHGEPVKNLFQGIEALRGRHVASWMIGYLHQLRIFGNEAAHFKEPSRRSPAYIDPEDQVVAVHCLTRVVIFWTTFRRDRKDRAGNPAG
ncbi:MAG: DUF4145 domain-containing protein [Acidobacteriota bacterium]|nr:DUF4145 domain-containing protein [Acidobacteriota bacterium]